MRAKQLDEILTDVMLEKLTDARWRKSGTSLVFEHADAQLVLRRVESRYIPPAEYTAYFRHRFLRDSQDRTYHGIGRESFDYPVQVSPFSLDQLLEPSWRLDAFSLRQKSVAVLRYEETDETYVSTFLSRMLEHAAQHAHALTEVLTPRRMFEELSMLPNRVWIEDRWMADYAKHLEFLP
jgi:hypothetical protein